MFSFFLSFPFLSFFCREYTTPWYQFLQASASPNLRSVSISHVENYSESFAFSGTELWGLAAAESRKSVSSKQHWSMIRGGAAATADVLSDLQSSSLSFASLGADLQRTRPHPWALRQWILSARVGYTARRADGSPARLRTTAIRAPNGGE